MIRRGVLTIGGAAALGILLGAVLFSPAIFLPIRHRLSQEDWLILSSIGQAYGFAAALLSALAFFGVIVSLRLQRQEMRANREQSARTLHQELMHLAIEDSDIRSVWRLVTETASDAELKQRLYVNMVFSHWEVLFLLGMMDETELRANARSIFESPAAHYYWSISKQHRLNVADTKVKRKFVTTIDGEYH